jgi:hypothetical protein
MLPHVVGCSNVRVVRNYGMFNRSQVPQLPVKRGRAAHERGGNPSAWKELCVTGAGEAPTPRRNPPEDRSSESNT